MRFRNCSLSDSIMPGPTRVRAHNSVNGPLDGAQSVDQHVYVRAHTYVLYACLGTIVAECIVYYVYGCGAI